MPSLLEAQDPSQIRELGNVSNSFTIRLSLIACFVAMTCLTSCSASRLILERDDVARFTQSYDDGQLRISGFGMHSAYVIERTTVNRAGADLIVLVQMTLAHGNLSDHLDYTIRIAPNIQRVLFGKQRSVIWTRGE